MAVERGKATLRLADQDVSVEYSAEPWGPTRARGGDGRLMPPSTVFESAIGVEGIVLILEDGRSAPIEVVDSHPVTGARFKWLAPPEA